MTPNPAALAVLVAEARALCDAATPGPWRQYRSAVVALEPDADPACCSKASGLDYCSSCDMVIMSGALPRDAAFIAFARQAVPALCAALAEQAGRVRGLTEERDALRLALATALRDGFNIARNDAEISEDDGWHRTYPFIEWGTSEKALEAAIAAVGARALAEGGSSDV